MCDNSASSTWEITNLTLTGTCQPTSVDSKIMPKVHPVSTFHKNITIYNLEDESVSVFDVYGRHISTQHKVSGNATFDVPASGVYRKN